MKHINQFLDKWIWSGLTGRLSAVSSQTCSYPQLWSVFVIGRTVARKITSCLDWLIYFFQVNKPWFSLSIYFISILIKLKCNEVMCSSSFMVGWFVYLRELADWYFPEQDEMLHSTFSFHAKFTCSALRLLEPTLPTVLLLLRLNRNPNLLAQYSWAAGES